MKKYISDLSARMQTAAYTYKEPVTGGTTAAKNQCAYCGNAGY